MESVRILLGGLIEAYKLDMWHQYCSVPDASQVLIQMQGVSRRTIRSLCSMVEWPGFGQCDVLSHIGACWRSCNGLLAFSIIQCFKAPLRRSCQRHHARV